MEKEKERESKKRERKRKKATKGHTRTHTHTHTSKRAHDHAHTSISQCPLELGEVKRHAFIFIGPGCLEILHLFLPLHALPRFLSRSLSPVLSLSRSLALSLSRSLALSLSRSLALSLSRSLAIALRVCKTRWHKLSEVLSCPQMTDNGFSLSRSLILTFLFFRSLALLLSRSLLSVVSRLQKTDDGFSTSLSFSLPVSQSDSVTRPLALWIPLALSRSLSYSRCLQTQDSIDGSWRLVLRERANRQWRLQRPVCSAHADKHDVVVFWSTASQFRRQAAGNNCQHTSGDGFLHSLFLSIDESCRRYVLSLFLSHVSTKDRR